MPTNAANVYQPGQAPGQGLTTATSLPSGSTPANAGTAGTKLQPNGQYMTDDQYQQWRAQATQAAQQAQQAVQKNLGLPPGATSVSFGTDGSPIYLDANGKQVSAAGGAPASAAGPAAAAPIAAPGPATPVQRSDYQLPGFDQLNSVLQQRQQAVVGRAAPQAQDSDARAGQTALAQLLQGYANGSQSASALQLQQANQANMAQQLALAASGRPGDSALNARLAAQNIGTIGAGLAQQQALAGIQEQRSAQDALSGLLGNTRQQDLGLNTFNTGAQLQTTSQNDQASQQALAQQLQAAQLQQQGSQAFSTNQAMQQLSQQQLQQQALLAQLQAQTQLQVAGQSNPLLNGLLNGGGSLLAWLASQNGGNVAAGGGGSAPTGMPANYNFGP